LFPVVWFRLERKSRHRIYLSFPVALFVLTQLIDTVIDILDIVGHFIPEHRTSDSDTGPGMFTAITAGMHVLRLILAESAGSGPYDLVDIQTSDVIIRISVL
jgi:hypothetical protein